jgi:hypothetical protein
VKPPENANLRVLAVPQQYVKQSFSTFRNLCGSASHGAQRNDFFAYVNTKAFECQLREPEAIAA